MNLKKKIQKYCTLCGTQSCNPYDPELRAGCPHFNPEVKQRQKELDKWIKENMDKIKDFLKERENV